MGDSMLYPPCLMQSVGCVVIVSWLCRGKKVVSVAECSLMKALSGSVVDPCESDNGMWGMTLGSIWLDPLWLWALREPRSRRSEPDSANVSISTFDHVSSCFSRHLLLLLRTSAQYARRNGDLLPVISGGLSEALIYYSIRSNLYALPTYSLLFSTFGLWSAILWHLYHLFVETHHPLSAWSDSLSPPTSCPSPRQQPVLTINRQDDRNTIRHGWQARRDPRETHEAGTRTDRSTAESQLAELYRGVYQRTCQCPSWCQAGAEWDCSRCELSKPSSRPQQSEACPPRTCGARQHWFEWRTG